MALGYHPHVVRGGDTSSFDLNKYCNESYLN